MSTVRCPQGHESTADDYCDTCGTPIGTPADTGGPACPGCGWSPDPSARYCEACGRELTTAPRPSASQPVGPADAASGPSPGSRVVGWVAETWVDPDWHATREDSGPCPPPGPPSVVPLSARSVLVGRRSTSRSIRPDVDCADDPGVSRRQAQLTTDGSRWWVEDLGSANGTYVGPADGPLPSDPVPSGERREVGEGDRVFLGSWTRLAVRRAETGDPTG